MPRILFWNVQLFSDDKFFQRMRKRKRDGDEAWGENAAQNYLDHLVDMITLNNPHIVIIAEVRPAGNTGAGNLLTDGGTLNLLQHLRLNVPLPGGTNWALVPPVISGAGNAGEGIAVYFRRTATFYFTGPWIWPGGFAGPAGPNAVPALYPAPWNTSFSAPVSNRAVPGGNNLYNAGAMERRLAGQWMYVAGGGGPGGAGGMGVPPAPIMFGGVGTRAPFRTTFYDSVAGHNYNIFSFHAAPSQSGGGAAAAAAPSTLATAAAGNLAEVQAVGMNQTTVVVGDFNVSLFNAAATAVAYAPFVGNGFVQVINTVAAAPVPVGFPNKGYLITHIQTDTGATPSWTNGYPAFGYMSVPQPPDGDYDSIDNAFVLGGAVANATIANPVTGVPYNAVPVPAGMPPGTLIYPSTLNDLGALNSPNGRNPNGMNFQTFVNRFQGITEYGLIYGVSDHFPIVFDV